MEKFNIKRENNELEKRELLRQTTAYINAGGRGTRLNPLFQEGKTGITKALIEFNDKTLLHGHLDILLKAGLKNIIIGAGDHFNIKDRFYDLGVENVAVSTTDTQEGTGGDLIKTIRNETSLGKNVLVENVDTIVYIKDLGDLLLQHEKSRAMATIVLTTKKGVPNEGAFFIDRLKRVVFNEESGKISKPSQLNQANYFRGSSTGVVVFKSDFLKNFQWKSGDGALSIYKDILEELIKNKQLYAYNNEGNFFIDIGTPEKYKQIKRHEKSVFGALKHKYMQQFK